MAKLKGDNEDQNVGIAITSRAMTEPLPAAPAYHGHRPEQTELYSIINEHYPRFVEEIERSGGHLPRFVRQEFEDYLKCGLLEHGFLRVKCDGCMHEHLVAFSCKEQLVQDTWWRQPAGSGGGGREVGSSRAFPAPDAIIGAS